MSEIQNKVMMKCISIQGFKGFKNTNIGPLRRINLILGGPNVGKTSLLEAMYFGGERTSVATPFRLLEGNDQKRLTVTSFHQDFKIFFKDTKSPLVSSKWDNILPISLHLPSQTELTDTFEQLVKSRRKREVTEILRKIDPRLEDMHGLFLDGDRRIYVELTGVAQALPLHQMGHGFSRLVYLYCSLLAANPKLALIDELENGIHYSSLSIVFEGLRHLAIGRDVQLIMTTQSSDVIRSAYNTFAQADQLAHLQLIRLEREPDNIRAVLINDEALTTVMEAGYEIR